MKAIRADPNKMQCSVASRVEPHCYGLNFGLTQPAYKHEPQSTPSETPFKKSFSGGPIVDHFHALSGKAVSRRCVCTGSSEPLLLTNASIFKVSCAGQIINALEMPVAPHLRQQIWSVQVN